MRVVEAAREEIEFASAMQRQELRPAFARLVWARALFRVVIPSEGLRLARRGICFFFAGRKTNSRSLGPIRKIRGWPRDDNIGECGGGAFPVNEQVHLAGKPRERRHYGAAVVIFDDELRNENRIGQVRERVVEALGRVHAAQRVEIGFGVFADEQWRWVS